MRNELTKVSCLFIGLSLLPACGSDSPGGGGGAGGGGAGGTAGAGGTSNPNGGSSGAPVATGALLGSKCTAAAQCATVLSFAGECFADFPNGGFCSHQCSDDGDCFQDNVTTDHFSCVPYQGNNQCLLSCLNRADITKPLACASGLTCDGMVCRPSN